MSITKDSKIEASDITTSLNEKAPTSHASSATTYGIGTDSNYGHTKLSDATNSTSSTSAGIAATPKAVKAAYDLASTANTTAVKLTGDQTIAGVKTFSSIPVFPSEIKMNDGTTIRTVVTMKYDGSTTYGSELLIGAGGNVYIGSGESHTGMYNLQGSSSSENMYVCSDGSVTICTNCQTPANAKKFVFNADGTTNFSASPKAYVTATYSSGTNWYRKWSDGWIEQGGSTSAKKDASEVVTFPHAFSNTNYTVVTAAGVGCSGKSHANIIAKTNTTCTVLMYSKDDSPTFPGYWYACGK